MFRTKFIYHKDVTPDLLTDIISIKQIAWGYTIKEQMDWLNRNLCNSDIHVLLVNNDKIVAYLNLIDINLKIDSIDFNGYGIGNVCAHQRGTGVGKILINSVNLYLESNMKPGLLFCKHPLIKFYQESGWVIINEIIITPANIYTLSYNTKSSDVEYYGKSF